MKSVYAVLSLVLATLPLSADLTQYTRRDPRLDVHPINTRYDQIAGYQAQSRAWEDKFKGAYGAEWEILVDVRGGRPGRLVGRAGGQGSGRTAGKGLTGRPGRAVDKAEGWAENGGGHDVSKGPDSTD